MELALYLILDLITYIVYFTFPAKILTLKENRKWLLPSFVGLNLLESLIVRTIPAIYASPVKSLVYITQYAIYICLSFKEPLWQKIIAYIFYLLSITGADIAVLGLFSILGYDYTDSVLGLSMLFVGGALCTFFVTS